MVHLYDMHEKQPRDSRAWTTSFSTSSSRSSSSVVVAGSSNRLLDGFCLVVVTEGIRVGHGRNRRHSPSTDRAGQRCMGELHCCIWCVGTNNNKHRVGSPSDVSAGAVSIGRIHLLYFHLYWKQSNCLRVLLVEMMTTTDHVPATTLKNEFLRGTNLVRTYAVWGIGWSIST